MPTSTRNYNIITDVNPKSYISEAYRTLRTNIQFSTIDNHIRSIIVTSPEPSEGKSTTITNLAVAFAQEGKKVVLVDADLRKPTLHHFFMKSNRIGLSNLLAGQFTLQQAISDTHIDNLSLICSGPVPPNPAEMLNSKRLEQQLEELKEMFDIILFDAPPTLAVTDAQVLSTKCDGVVFVLNSGKVKRDTARKAIDRLNHVNAKILGVVLNNKDRNKNESPYYYYYGPNDKK
ncbi:MULTISPECIES: CpsD/CapB family tyrosine-protein kinase [Paenibacillus]|uniref:CpsD/CapB family tyrosine-protein kinase n=1 Tax=Paenibacillus TaxID=44249 RepID=UPI0015770770|nr:CpsD/CapB family tyrosine-protein kinase [Paenibacillus sp. JMULE4]NTZ17864.1 polysaccharide biosynthesis tyrosine autokinase [Paenibacillus sp. JMULE4]